MNAWPENFYGLMAIQKFVAETAGMEVGQITVFSHSISIDPSALEKAKQIAESRKTDMVVDPVSGKTELRFDPNGEFTVTFDRNTRELVIEHSFGGMKIHEYRGKTAEEMELQLSRDMALSEISHALYLGREIARVEMNMKNGRKY
jgi:thymidylate synthase